MPTGFSIEKEDRDIYKQSVHDTNIEMEETAIRAAIASWAKFKEPTGATWMYVWNAASE